MEAIREVESLVEFCKLEVKVTHVVEIEIMLFALVLNPFLDE